jgi:uncharacterized YigZ family protein
MSVRFTLLGEASLQQEIRKSRFLAQAAPVERVADALAFVARVGDRDATHNCWAYRIGNEYRFSDDGEPAGTAGKPILQAIDGQSLDRVVVVVTRWFGGVKLGAGGLVRAYGGCAAECLRTAPRIAIVARTRASIRCDFAAAAALHAHFAEFGIAKLDERFDATGVDLAIELPAERLDALAKLVGDLTRGRGRVDAAT